MSALEEYWMYWTPDPNTGCYIWIGSMGGRSMRRPKFILGGKKRYACDVFAKEVYGPCPDGMEKSHTCGMQECVNPLHIKYETHADNMKRDRGTGKFHP